MKFNPLAIIIRFRIRLNYFFLRSYLSVDSAINLMAVVESSAEDFPSNLIPALPRKFSHHQDELSDLDPLGQHQVKDRFHLHHLHSHSNSVLLQENNLHNDSNIHLLQQENMLKKDHLDFEQNQHINKKTDSDATQWNLYGSYKKRSRKTCIC